MDLQTPQFLACREPAEARAWDCFLSRRSGVHIEQTSAWSNLRKIYGRNATRVWAARARKIVGGAMILTRRVGRFATIGYAKELK